MLNFLKKVSRDEQRQHEEEMRLGILGKDKSEMGSQKNPIHFFVDFTISFSTYVKTRKTWSSFL